MLAGTGAGVLRATGALPLIAAEHGPAQQVSAQPGAGAAVRPLPTVLSEFVQDPESPWRELHLDLGWYRTGFTLRLLDPDWEHTVDFHTEDIEEVVEKAEAWMLSPPVWQYEGQKCCDRHVHAQHAI